MSFCPITSEIDANAPPASLTSNPRANSKARTPSDILNAWCRDMERVAELLHQGEMRERIAEDIDPDEAGFPDLLFA